MLATLPILAPRRTPSRASRRGTPVPAARGTPRARPEGDDASRPRVSRQTSRPAFPFSRVVNHEPAKAALLLAAVDPNIGGVALYGRRGTCKTVLARAVHALLPALEEDDEEKNEEEKEETAGVEEAATHRSSTRARARRPPPFVTVPLSATEDAVVGTIDVEASARRGEPVYEPGLLARADRGVLYIDELNLADETVVDCALHAVALKRCVVERTGVSTSRHCRTLCVATWNPDEGEVRRRVVDALALHASADEPLSVERRVRGVELASAWMDDWAAVAEEARVDEAALAAAVAAARKTLARVRVTEAQLGWLVECAVRAGCVGHRAEIAAARACKASAALRGSEVVDGGDLNAAAALAIAPRATRPMETSPPQPQPPPVERADETEDGDEAADETESKEGTRGDEDEDDDKGDEDDREEDDEDDREEDDEDDETRIAVEDLVFAPEDRPDEPSVSFGKLSPRKRKPGKAGRAKKAVVFSFDRGRYVKPVFPKGGVVRRVAIDATLRAAAIHQRSRRLKRGDPPWSRRVRVEKDDIRNKKMSRAAGTLTVFLVDASGSMALNRMAAAKGAALRLLAESYTKRDAVALVSARGDAAEVILPPSRSVALAKARLAALPCGGGTPLAHGLSTAARVAINAARTGGGGVGGGGGGGGGGGKCSRTRVVLLTDGGANVGLDWSESTPEGRLAMTPYEPSKAALREEAMAVAGASGKAGVELLVVDTESEALRRAGVGAGVGAGEARRTNVAEDLARAAGGRYFRLPPSSGVGAGARSAAERLTGMLKA